MMNRPLFLWLLLVEASLLPNFVRADYEKIDQGVLVRVGDEQIVATAPAPGILHLGAAFGERPKAPASVFLAENPMADSWELVAQGDEVGIKTSTGRLLIDAKSGRWSLSDAAGKTVAQGAMASLRPDGGTVDLDVALPKPFVAYGTGNEDPSKAQLVKTEGNSHLGNGIAVIPYYWCTAGYGAFAVSANDDQPAKWAQDEKKGAVTWSFPGKTADIYLFAAKDLYQAARNYAMLVGHAPVPPKWAFGYLQSRWGWESKAYIDDVLKNFHEKKLPVDAFILDFECYTATPDYSLPNVGAVNFPDFGWNSALLPAPKANIADYLAQGLHIVPIRKPRMGDQATLEMFHSKNWILSTGGNGEKADLMNQRDVDFRNPEVRAWYAEHLAPMYQAGVSGWWNDEGESSYTKYYYWNLAQTAMEAGVDPDKRHWSLNRSFQPGLQRLGAAAWTGDVRSNWKVVAQTPASFLNWGLAGMPYDGCDIGGYKTDAGPDGKRPDTTDPELFARWMEAGVFFPIMRSHSAHKMIPHFPWLYGPEAETAIRGALELRYRLIPYYYSLAHETYATGAPLMRPLVMEFPDDTKVQNISDEWLMGTALMAAPILAPGGARTVYFPDDMLAFDGTQEFRKGNQIQIDAAPLGQIPAYVRKGSILPLGPVIQNTALQPGGPLEVQVYPGRDASFTLVEDDGLTNGYQKGKMRQTHFTWNETQRTLSWTQEGDYVGKDVFTRVKVVVLDPSGKKESPEADLGPSGSVKL